MAQPLPEVGTLVVEEIHIYPVHGEPGQTLTEVDVEQQGLAGDRRKKAAVQLVSTQDVTPDTRANLVLSLTSQQLAGSIGSVLRVGAAQLRVTGAPTSCPGVYAEVASPGTIRVGDIVRPD
ncbi:MAG TPA: MOSC domain-containing protein [Pedococcus sp.]|jgi:hypothetical protein|nr:MOSC domain-containing protein [Pedococcus sp.]